MKLSIIGLGFVGSAIQHSVLQKGFIVDESLFLYDKYKEGGIGSLQQCIDSDLLFLCLPTPFDPSKNQYDKSSIMECSEQLSSLGYKGVIILKSTVEPETTDLLSNKFPALQFIHNPEFLTARTANQDFHNQTHVVLGKPNSLSNKVYDPLVQFYSTYYPTALISKCSSVESESMKIFCNTFYSIKVQFFTELQQLCEKNGTDYNVIRSLMLSNKWIHPMHTVIPGPDGQISYGGACFPKDSNALLEYMKKIDSPHALLEASIKERNEMRKDH